MWVWTQVHFGPAPLPPIALENPSLKLQPFSTTLPPATFPTLFPAPPPGSFWTAMLRERAAESGVLERS